MAAWVRRKDRQHVFETMPYQEAPSPPMTPALYAACAQAVHVLKRDGGVLKAGRAALFILENVGWGWVARLLARRPFLYAVEIAYRFVASHRPFFARFLFRKEGEGAP